MFTKAPVLLRVKKQNFRLDKNLYYTIGDAIFSPEDLLMDISDFVRNSPSLKGYGRHLTKLATATSYDLTKFFFKPSSKTLGTALKNVGAKWSAGDHAHHIVPGLDGGKVGDQIREILRNFKIDINDAKNGIFLPPEIHNHVHTDKYFRYVLTQMQKVKNADQCSKLLKSIGQQLLNNVPIY